LSARRLLLIDNDPRFRRTLHQQLGPYGFEIHLADQGSADALGQVRELRPEIIFIAVEEPDKHGYSLCNKAKKGVASNIPVVLTTNTVPKKGFLSHKKLKVHADEYIDKRSMTADELFEKIDQLIGLGEAAAGAGRDGGGGGDVLDIPMEVEEVSLDEGESGADEMVVDEIDAGNEDDFEEGERTSIAPPSMLAAQPALPVDSAVAEETDAAFAALTSDPAIELSELDMEEPVEDEPEPELPEPPPVATRTPTPAPIAPVAAAPVAAIDDDGAVPAPIADGDAAPDLGLDRVAEMATEDASGVTDRKSLQKIFALEKENARLKSELEQAKAGAPAAAGEAGGFSREREFLNLREVINKKEREVLHLQDDLAGKERQILDGKDRIRQLEHAKASADSKNLQLEQHLLELQESRAAADADKTAAAARAEQQTARVATLEAELTELRQQSTGRIEELERRLAAEAERAARELADSRTTHAAEIDKLTSEHADAAEQLRSERVAALAGAESDARSKLQEAERSHAAALAELKRTVEGQRDAALAALRDEHAAKVDALEKAHAAVVEERENEQAATIAALVKQADDDRVALEQARAAALADAEERHRKALGERDAAHRTELQKLEDQHAGQLVRVDREKQTAITAAQKAKDEAIAAAQQANHEAVAAAKAAHDQALAEVQADREQALAAAASDKEQTVASLVARHQSAMADARVAAEGKLKATLAAAADERAASENSLQERFEHDKATMEQAHAEVVAALEEQRVDLDRGLTGARERIASLERTVAERDARIAAGEQAIAAHLAAIEDRDRKIATLKKELGELEEQNAGYQEQILKAYQKIKTDEATTLRAKKAIAIALTLLDEDAARAQGKKD